VSSLVLAAACGGAPVVELETSTSLPLALTGVPVDGFPNFAERAMLVAINRARSDPNNTAVGAASACSNRVPAQKPLVLSVEGSRAARFHSRSSIVNDTGLSHNSYCTLKSDIATSGCDGSAACACEAGSECFTCTTLGGCGTTPWTRAAYFNFAANGEVGAAGQGDGFSAVRTWVTECPPQDGHRRILSGEGIDVIGLGFADGASNCWSPFYFGDTGYQGIETPVLPAGVHDPELGADPSFYVSYFSPASAATVTR
jgi:hypothetical protein